MRARRFWRLLRARLAAWTVAREARRRRELACAIGPVSDRWIAAAIYDRGIRRED
jgi:hypothetical protein